MGAVAQAVGAIVGFITDDQNSNQTSADLGEIQQELEILSKSLEELNEKVADLPTIISDLLDRAHEKQQEREVISAIQLMQGGISSSEEVQRYWLLNLMSESQTLLQNSYFSAPIMVLAMKSEIAFLKQLGKETTNAEMRYFNRLQRMFNEDESDSLVKRIQSMNDQAKTHAKGFREEYKKIVKAYNAAPKEFRSCPSQISRQGCDEITITTCQLVDIDAVNDLKKLSESTNSEKINNFLDTHEFHAILIKELSKEMPVKFWKDFSENESLIDLQSDQDRKSFLYSQIDELKSVRKDVSDYLQEPFPKKEKWDWITIPRNIPC